MLTVMNRAMNAKVLMITVIELFTKQPFLNCSAFKIRTVVCCQLANWPNFDL